MLEDLKAKRIVEAALMASFEPLAVDQLMDMFIDGELGDENPRARLRDLLKQLVEEAPERGVELKQVASGYRYHVPQELSPWISKLWAEKPPRYSRALLETLALIAYKQPVTRGDIEQVRGVAVSQNIMRTLVERGWIRVVGQREVPGRPSMYGTTKAFLDYFNLKSLDQLPSLPEVRALVEPHVVADESGVETVEEAPGDSENSENSAEGDANSAVVHVELEEADESASAEDVDAANVDEAADGEETETETDAADLPGANVIVLPTVDKAQ